MKVVKNNNKNNQILYKRKAIEGSFCNYCKGKNIFNSRCIDCGVKANDELFYFNRDIKYHHHEIRIKFELSPAQKKASTFFLNLFKNHQNGYLNAVCGSGKTEIMYEVILYALNNNLKALVAIPRVEIVKELYERIKDVFYLTRIKYLDGLHHDTDAELLLSTVNQLIQFEDEFDLIILDEADAFPYSQNDYLHRLVKKALKDNGVLILMSATEKERIVYDRFTMNRRYHKADLSMPLFIKYYETDIINNEYFKKIITNQERKFIIYTKSIKDAYLLSDKLNTKYISSKTKDARRLIKNFKESNEHLLISTTILERGITINNLDVIIVDADDKVFTHQTIIQICGRVGRSYLDPHGNIYIFYRLNKLKFLSVKRYIRRMNEM